jgi:bifunctional DNA-binding transcriptional regulator/antitoxin component of YhaV-PrlF toxin-antitoxin module
MTYRTKLLDGRVPLPIRLRALAGVSDGDPVDITVVKGGLLVTPARRAREIAKPASQTQQRRAVVARLRKEAPESLKAMWADAKRQGTDKLSMREVDAIIAEVRSEQAAKRRQTQPVE